jgi:hypothetical protein
MFCRDGQIYKDTPFKLFIKDDKDSQGPKAHRVWAVENFHFLEDKVVQS